MKALAALLLMTTAAYAQQPWSGIAERCGAEVSVRIIEKTGREGTGDQIWPSKALCAVKVASQNKIPETDIKKCIDYVWNYRLQHRVANQHGNPVDETFFCLQGK